MVSYELLIDLELTGVWLGLWFVNTTSVEAVVAKIAEFVDVEPTNAASVEAFKFCVDLGSIQVVGVEASPSRKFGAICWDEQDPRVSVIECPLSL